MQFEETTMNIDTPFGVIQAVVASDALEVLNAEAPASETGNALVAAHREMLELVANMKFEAGEAETERSVRITADDLI